MIQRIRTSSTSNQEGFTLIELLLAVAFIGFLLLFIVFAMLQVMGNYNKGLAVKSINQTARSVVEEMSRMARSTNAESINTTKVGNGRLCFGGVGYVWNVQGSEVNKYTDGSRVTMARVEDSEVCSDSLPAIQLSKAVALLASQVWVQEVTGTLSASNKLINLSVRLSTAAENQPTGLGPDGPVCVGGVTGNYCAVAKFTTTVSTRNGGQ